MPETEKRIEELEKEVSDLRKDFEFLATKRVDALERAIAFMADEEAKTPVAYTAYKKLKDRIDTVEILQASRAGNFRTIATVALGFFSWLGGITTIIFGEWIRAQFFGGGSK